MVDHTIEAKFEVKAGAAVGPKSADLGDLVAPIAAALREVSQAQCVDAEERRALEILTALRVIGERQAMQRQKLLAAYAKQVQHQAFAPDPATEQQAPTAVVPEPELSTTPEEVDFPPDAEPAVPAKFEGGNQD